ncbi:MAG: hypothetical protein KKG59_05195 [Nanoarchaeota archaeon]|nr:hypothetical protein [Nanoarchaeota archaeon]
MVHVAILAGSRFRKYIKGEPKCFLDMPAGETIVEEILYQIQDIKKIKDIVIVGPKYGLKKIQERDLSRFNKKIYLTPQGTSQQENLGLAKKTIVKKNKLKGKKADDLGLLILLGDTPFRNKCGVEEFIKQVENTKADFVSSLVHEQTILKYYPYFKKPMIPLFVQGQARHFKETNMAYFNPDKLDSDLLRKFYSLRHTSKVKTMFAMRELVHSIGGTELLDLLERYFFIRHWHRVFRRFTPRAFHSPCILYRKLDKDKLIHLAERILGVKIEIVFSSYPDGYIDLDKKGDYKKIFKHYFELKAEIDRDCKQILKTQPPKRK